MQRAPGKGRPYNKVVRFTADSAASGNKAVTGSEILLFRLPGLMNRNHNGGAGFERPISAYRHGSSEIEGCAITGGAFYSPETSTTARFPDEYEGDYFLSGICSGWIRKFDPETKEATGFKSRSSEASVDLKGVPEGDLLFLNRAGGSVEQIRYTTPAP